MKKIIVLIISFLFVSPWIYGAREENGEDQDPGNLVQVYSSPDLAKLVSEWVSEYSVQNTGIEIN